MKRIVLLLSLLVAFFTGFSQSKGYLRYDSLYIQGSLNGEIVLLNGTRDSTGFLFNKGGGRTIFKRALQKINDSIYLVGGDTLKTSSGTASRNSFSATAPLVYNNLTGIFSLPQGNNTTDGFINHTDWSIFNGKQNAITWNNVTAGSSKITLGGTPNGSSFLPFSIDVNEANLTLGNMGGTLPISKGGTGAITQAQALNNLAPPQTGNAGKVLQTDGAGNITWAKVDTGTTISTLESIIVNGGGFTANRTSSFSNFTWTIDSGKIFYKVHPNYTNNDSLVLIDLKTLKDSMRTVRTLIPTVPVQSVNGQIGNVLIDGSETKVTQGSNVTITGAGTVASPYVINAAASGTTYTPGTGIGITSGIISNTGALSFNTRTGAITPLSTDYASFYVPLARTLTINGSTQDLSANRTFTVPVLTLFSGTGLVNYSNTTGVINVDSSAGLTHAATQAFVLNQGFLTSIDTGNIPNFSVKVRSEFTGVSPIVYNNGFISLDTTKIHSSSYNDGRYLQNITGKIVQGANVTITGSGTALAPYVINSSGGGGIDSAIIGGYRILVTRSGTVRTVAVDSTIKDTAFFHTLGVGDSSVYALNGNVYVNTFKDSANLFYYKLADGTIVHYTKDSAIITTNGILKSTSGYNQILQVDSSKYATLNYVNTHSGSGSVLSVSGTTNRITSSGGTAPVIDISSSYVGQASITTVGALSSGSLATGFTLIGNSFLANSTISGVSLGSNLFSLTPGYGLTGSAYNGSSAQPLILDTSSTHGAASKDYVNARVGGGGGITALTGDGTASGTGSVALTLATVNSSPGTYGTASSVPQTTVNGKGLNTLTTNVPIQISETQVTNLTSDLSGKQSTLTSTLNTLTISGANAEVTHPNVRMTATTSTTTSFALSAGDLIKDIQFDPTSTGNIYVGSTSGGSDIIPVTNISPSSNTNPNDFKLDLRIKTASTIYVTVSNSTPITLIKEQ